MIAALALALDLSGTLIALVPPRDPAALAEVTVENFQMNGPHDNGTYPLELDGLVVLVTFHWEYGPAGEDAVIVTPPPGRDLRACRLHCRRAGNVDRRRRPVRFRGVLTVAQHRSPRASLLPLSTTGGQSSGGWQTCPANQPFLTDASAPRRGPGFIWRQGRTLRAARPRAGGRSRLARSASFPIGRHDRPCLTGRAARVHLLPQPVPRVTDPAACRFCLPGAATPPAHATWRVGRLALPALFGGVA